MSKSTLRDFFELKSLLNVVLSAKNFYDNVVGVQFAMGNASFSIKKTRTFFVLD